MRVPARPTTARTRTRGASTTRAQRRLALVSPSREIAAFLGESEAADAHFEAAMRDNERTGDRLALALSCHAYAVAQASRGTTARAEAEALAARADALVAATGMAPLPPLAPRR